MKQSSPEGFSLLEIIVALGLFAIVVLGLLQLFPRALMTQRDTQFSTRATFIAASLFSTLQAAKSEGILLTEPDALTNSSHRLSFSLKNPAAYDVAYDSSNEPVRLLTAEESISPLRGDGISSIAHISISNNEQPGIAHVEVIVSAPASEAEKQRHHVYFCKLISTLPRHEKE